MKNKLFIQGLILASGQICGKILSLMFIFLLAEKIKPIGLYLYTYAYIPFSLFLDLSSFGIIPGVSRTISKLLAKEEDNKVTYILKTGTIINIILGIIFFIIVNFFSQNILKATLYSGYTKEEYELILNNLKTASLSLLIFPLLSFYKGFLQGHLRMLPSSLAIILETFTRTFLFILISNNIDYSIFSSIFILNFLSYLLALFLLFCFIFPYYFKKS
ncbi:MAG: oligosaccharide flippase family protein [Anaeroplasma sp.]